MAKARVTTKSKKPAAKAKPKKLIAAKAKRPSRGRWSKLVKPAAKVAAKKSKPKKRATTALVKKAAVAADQDNGYLADNAKVAEQSYLGPKPDFPSAADDTLAETEETRDYVSALSGKASANVAQGADEDADPEFEGACKKLGLTEEDGPIGREMAIGLASVAPKAPEGSVPIPDSDTEATADDHEEPAAEDDDADPT